MRRGSVTLPVACMIAIAITGCGSGQETPRATIEKMFAASEEGDAAAFLECFETDEHQRTVLEAVAETSTAVRELRDAVVKHHGEEGWRSFADLVGALRYGTKPDLDQLAVTENNGDATARLPGGARPMKLVRRDGTWKIVPEKVPGGDQESRRLADLFRARAEGVRNVTAEVGKPGVDLKTLQRRLLAETGRALLKPR